MEFRILGNRRMSAVYIFLSLMTLSIGTCTCADEIAHATAAIDNLLSAPLVIPQDGFNLKIVEHITPTYFVVKLTSPVHNWFAGTFTNIPTDQEVTIGLSLQEVDTGINKADVSKWQGLRPVMTYANPAAYETYEWFTKDENERWVSSDPFKVGEEKFAGTGVVPIQRSVPKNVAEQFLSKDGKYWSAWREVDNTEVIPNLNIFRIKQRFALRTVTVAMRVPFTYTYLQDRTFA